MPIQVKVAYAKKTIPFTAVKRTADSALAGLGTVEDGLRVNKLATEGLEQGLTAAKIDYDAKFLEQAQKFGTFDAKLIAEQNKIRKNEINIGRNQATIDTVDGKARQALGQAGDALGKAADLFDRVSNIFNLIATLGTAARMESIYNELKGVDSNLQKQISEVKTRLNNAFDRIQNNESDIDSLEREMVGIANSLEFIKNQNRGILQNTSSLLSGQSSINSNVTEVRRDTEWLQDFVPQIDDNVINQIQNKVCLALNSDCWDRGVGSGGNTDISEIKSDIKSILQKIGIFPYNCSTQQPSDGNYTTISESLQRLTCSFDGFGDWGENSLENDIQSIKEGLETTEESLRLAIINAIVDNRMILADVAEIETYTADNLAKFLNQIKKQQLIDFETIPLFYDENTITVPSADFATVIDRTIPQISQAIANKEADRSATLDAIDALLEEDRIQLTEDRADSEATVNIEGLPFDYL